MQRSAAPSPSRRALGEVLSADPDDGRHLLGDDLRGFGGVHGGLGVALAAVEMQRLVGEHRLLSVSAQFDRALDNELTVDARVTRRGATVTTATAELLVSAAVAARVTATFGRARGEQPLPQIAPERLPAPPPAECPLVGMPVEFVPFGQHTEIRAVGADRPFAGGDRAELTAWIRLVDGDDPADAARIVTLLDALAPSASAIVDRPIPMPTVEYRVDLGRAAPSNSGPWLLLHARTSHAAEAGWFVEHIDAWTEGGVHVAAATQLRAVLAG